MLLPFALNLHMAHLGPPRRSITLLSAFEKYGLRLVANNGMWPVS